MAPQNGPPPPCFHGHSLPVQGGSGRPGSTRRRPRLPGPARGPGSLKMQGKRQLTLAPGQRPFQRGRGLWPGARPRWGLGRGADPNTHSLAPRLVQARRSVGCLLSRAGACSPGTHGHLAWLSGERIHISQEANWLQRPGKFQVQRAPQPQLLPLSPTPKRVPMHAPPRAVPGVCGQRLPRWPWPCRSLGAVTAAPARRPRSPRGPGAPPRTTCWSGSSSGCARGAGPPASACG